MPSIINEMSSTGPLDDTMPSSSEDIRPSQTTTSPVTEKDPVIVGIYGISGCGKTFLLGQLERELGREHFAFYEGSKVISSLVPGGLDAFRKLGEEDKTPWRHRAIESIREGCIQSGKLGVVTGHLMFWPEQDIAGRSVYTKRDLEIYTHILYLDVPAEIVAQRCRDDTERHRPTTSADHLRKWQDAEKTLLRGLCPANNILFCSLSTQATLVERLSAFIRDFRYHDEAYNLSRAESRLDEVLGAGKKKLETMLVLDADKTLTAGDTGRMFWAKVAAQSGHGTDRLKTLFDGPLGYSYNAFRQAALMYEEAADENEFDALCTDVASEVQIHPEFLTLLRPVTKQDHVGAVVVTCGLRRVWDKILQAHDLSGTVKVVGGGRVADGFVVTAAVKGDLVARLRDVHGLYVVAFGDSPLDLPMLSGADEAVVVVGRDDTRSRSMDGALREATKRDGLRASQVLLPDDDDAVPRPGVADLPRVRIDGPVFARSVGRRRRRAVRTPGDDTARLLATPTRDAGVSGPDLRAAHHRVGWFLAAAFLPGLVGLEQHPIPHVQGHQAAGFRLRHEPHTLVVALMRGGEPMALGVSDALPRAAFVHARDPADLRPPHLAGTRTVILVDSVVNSGATVVAFVDRVRALRPAARVVVVAGVVQEECVARGGRLAARRHVNGGDGDGDGDDDDDDDDGLDIVALRLSENKFTGSGATDTGNRLFNTTSLP